MTNSSLGQGHEARVSVNLDIANLPAEAAATILKEAVNYGRVVTARAFSDFRRNDLGDLPVQLFQLGFQLIHCPSWPNGGGRLKSVVDSILAQDLRDQAENDPTLDVFILGSGDRDFLAVVHALRRHGRKVIIASTADASNRSLLATADGYIQIQAPERHTFHVPAAQMYAPQPPAAVYSGPVTSLPAIAAPAAAAASQTAPAPVRHTAPHLPSRQRHAERGMRSVAAPAVTATPPIAALPPAVHPLQPQRQAAAAPFGRAARQTVPSQTPVTAPVAAVLPEPEPELEPALAATPVTYPHLTAATLHAQIMDLVLSQPQITPRQVLQALAPRAEAGSARRRQAIGDAIAQLLQQGRLARRTEVVRGRPAEVLSVSDGAQDSVTPLEAPFAPAEEAATPSAPVRRETTRSRLGERRAGRAAQPSVFHEPLPEPDVDLAVDFAAADLEPVVSVPAAYPEDVLDGLAAWEPELAPADEATTAAIAATGPEAAPEPEPSVERTAPERSTLVGRRTTPAPKLPAATVEPVRPARRFRAPVFTHTPEVVETAQAAAEQPAPAAEASQEREPEAAFIAEIPAPSIVAEAPAQQQEQALPVGETTGEAAEEVAATAAARPRRRRTRTRSSNGKGEVSSDGDGSAAGEGEAAAATVQ